MARTRPRASGFTLMELAIICGIASIAIALLVSVISSVRRNGRRLICTSNLRQIGVAIHAYAADNHGEIPAVYDPLNAGFRPTSWFSGAVRSKDKGIGGMLLLFGRPFGDARRLYLDTPAVFRCPGDSVDLDRWGSDDRYNQAFSEGAPPVFMSYNYAYIPEGGAADPLLLPKTQTWTSGQFAGLERHNVNQRAAATTAIMVEASAYNALWLPQHPGEYHGQGGNVLYLDGHEAYGLADAPDPDSMPRAEYIKYLLRAADQITERLPG